MVIQPTDNLPEAWETAVERLNSIGVFADERRQFPESQSPGQFYDEIKGRGYIGGPLEIGELSQIKNGVSSIIFDKTKLTGVDDAILAWDKDYNTRWRKTVTDRVSNWLQRLNDLQTTMRGWLPETMTIVQRPPIRMHEELMSKFGVSPANMPTFDINKAASRIMRVQPKGLWIIGANGRVDLVTPTASYILVDKSRPSMSNTDWHFYHANNKRQSTALSKATFVDLLK